MDGQTTFVHFLFLVVLACIHCLHAKESPSIVVVLGLVLFSMNRVDRCVLIKENSSLRLQVASVLHPLPLQ